MCVVQRIGPKTVPCGTLSFPVQLVCTVSYNRGSLWLLISKCSGSIICEHYADGAPVTASNMVGGKVCNAATCAKF